MSFNPGISALIKMREFRHRNTQREDGHVIMKMEIGVKQLQAKELKEFSAALRSWSKVWKGFPYQSLQMEYGVADTWVSDSCPPKRVRVNFCCFKPHAFMELCDS